MTQQIREDETQAQFTMRLMRDEWQGQALTDVEELAREMFGQSEVGDMFVARLELLRGLLKVREV